MADPRGFLTTPRETASRRPVEVRIRDFGEVYEQPDTELVRRQAGRCMDCGVPFCHGGCPLGNLIPDWNDVVWRDDWRTASERLHATNNFPEFTGRMCPAPCEQACVLGINADPVSIKVVEQAIADRAFAEGWITPQLPETRSGLRIAVVGSGPGGLAAAQQLTRVGHDVTVFERSDRIGGLVRYGIPDFKMDKALLDRRLEQMAAEGTVFRTGVDVGVDISVEELRTTYDAIVLATGALAHRDVPVPGRDLDGVHYAMHYLELANRVQAGDLEETPVSAAGKHVVIIGGGDTGADCYGTALRQGATSVTQLQIHPQPPSQRTAEQPWPTIPLLFTVAAVHEEGGERVYAVNTEEFVDDGNGAVRALRLSEGRRVDGTWQHVEDSERELPCDLALLAIGFSGPERGSLLDGLGVTYTPRGAIRRDAHYRALLDGDDEDAAPVFVAGDAGRGASLIVWAIAEGRAAAASVDAWLRGRTALPRPLDATAAALRL
ncbi:MAG TPA: glutamate synthase subunit beta [Acidothermales bacterium]